ncbi:MAG: 2-hydroxyglutaryl-CoA dehydratase [Dehalococcoidia bacterium]|nr:MAG: 2-hydroxyglutaryl-CoA dehydratase [Dehalococcoidia bacterium]UCG82127.1 MAG: 2-hydroxyglutaryl-CoA dehydratase [Dehalococcoidia bacterium]
MIFAGCDLGILSAKVAVIRGSDILASEILPYKNHPQQAAVEVMDRALAKADISREQIDYCLSTGFGMRAVTYADNIVPPTLCLHRAIRELNPRVRTVIDVGGHSFTAFNIDDNGKVSESAITDKCAAGTGRFIEVMAEALEMSVEELSRVSLTSNSPLRVTGQCVILAESDVISHVHDGNDPVDIFAGIASAVAAKIAGLARRISVNEEVAMTGGVAKNCIVVRDFEKEIGVKLADLDGIDPQLVGAYGAALMARESPLTT